MKKIVFNGQFGLSAYDSTDYIILEKDNQRISDKYVDYWGHKINEYGDLKKGDIIIRELYYFYHYGDYLLRFKKFKHYNKLPNFKTLIDKQKSNKISKLNKNLDSKNSVIDFDMIKKWIIALFSEEIKKDI